jgi:hypothetical protein
MLISPAKTTGISFSTVAVQRNQFKTTNYQTNFSSTSGGLHASCSMTTPRCNTNSPPIAHYNPHSAPDSTRIIVRVLCQRYWPCRRSKRLSKMFGELSGRGVLLLYSLTSLLHDIFIAVACDTTLCRAWGADCSSWRGRSCGCGRGRRIDTVTV